MRDALDRSLGYLVKSGCKTYFKEKEFAFERAEIWIKTSSNQWPSIVFPLNLIDKNTMQDTSVFFSLTLVYGLKIAWHGILSRVTTIGWESSIVFIVLVGCIPS